MCQPTSQNIKLDEFNFLIIKIIRLQPMIQAKISFKNYIAFNEYPHIRRIIKITKMFK